MESLEEGYIKINTYGSWEETTQEAGLGYILRDSERKAILAVAHSECNSALHAELIGVL